MRAEENEQQDVLDAAPTPAGAPVAGLARYAPRSPLWRDADFMRFWAAQSISQFGTPITQLALPLIAIIALGATPFQVALLGALEFLPFLLFTLPTGVWVDRLPRRPILVFADVGRAVALASVPLAAIADVLTIWQLYAVGFAAGTLTVFFDVAYQSYLPALVGREQLVDGNSKLEFSRSGAQVAGPGVGGQLIGALTAPYAIAAYAASYVVSALLLGRIRKSEPRPERHDDRSLKREIVEGLRLIFDDARWRAFAGYVATSNFFGMVIFAVLLVYAVRELGLSAELLGLVFSLAGGGAVLGALAAGRISRRIGTGPTLILAAAASGPSLLLVPLAPQSFPLPFLVAAEFIFGFWVIVFNITGISYIQAVIPDRLLGRMNASRRFLVWGTMPLGSLTGGALATASGLRETLFVGAAGASLSFVWLVFSPWRGIRGA